MCESDPGCVNKPCASHVPHMCHHAPPKPAPPHGHPLEHPDSGGQRGGRCESDRFQWQCVSVRSHRFFSLRHLLINVGTSLTSKPVGFLMLL